MFYLHAPSFDKYIRYKAVTSLIKPDEPTLMPMSMWAMAMASYQGASYITHHACAHGNFSQVTWQARIYYLVWRRYYQPPTLLDSFTHIREREGET